MQDYPCRKGLAPRVYSQSARGVYRIVEFEVFFTYMRVHAKLTFTLGETNDLTDSQKKKKATPTLMAIKDKGRGQNILDQIRRKKEEKKKG